ncbi:MAG: hypothetical protein AAF696_17175, partial [Bacteroidota bacterium]
MKSKLPSSILVSLYLSIGLTLLYVFIKSGYNSWNFTESLGEILLFLFITFLSLVITLEWL